MKTLFLLFISVASFGQVTFPMNNVPFNYGFTTQTAHLGYTKPLRNTGSFVNQNSWFSYQTLPVSGNLVGVSIYCSGSGTVKIKIAQPVKGASFTITSTQTLSVVSGLNVFSVAKGTMSAMAYPANSMVGFYPSSASLVYYNSVVDEIGCINGAGDILGTNQVISSIAGGTPQFTFKIEYQGGQSNAQYFIDENFAGTHLPALALITGTSWNFTAGQATPGATGLGNFLSFIPFTGRSYTTVAIEFIFQTGTDLVDVGRSGMLGNTQGTIGEADIANNKIVLYEQYNGTTTFPTTPNVSKTLTTITLTTGVRYRLELIRNGGFSSLVTLKITDTTNGNNEQVTATNDGGLSGTLCAGRPFVSSRSGTTWQLKDFKFYSAKQNPYFIVIGNSITNGAYANAGDPWAEQCVNFRSSADATFSGSPSSSSVQWITWILYEQMLSITPYVVLAVGINDTGSDAAVTTWETNIVYLYNRVLALGSTPVVCKIMPNGSSTVNTRVQTMNTFLATQPWKFINLNLPVSVGNDGITWNSSLFGDNTHPNDAGHTLCFNQVKTDAPYLFYK